MRKSLLFSGSNGFLGKSILPLLEKQYKIITLDLSNADIKCDLSETLPHFSLADIVIHAAGKAHLIPKTKEEEDLFFKINYQGTTNILKALENNLPQSFIFISTVAVYGLEEGEMITEDFPLNGNSPYALSKIKAEEAVLEWSKKFNVPTVILRLPLIAGYPAPGNLGHMIRAIQKGYYFRIGKGKARRSMILAKDLADFIPVLYQKSGIFHLTDGHHPSFKELEEYIAIHFKKKIRSIPNPLVAFVAKLGDLFSFIPINTNRLVKLQSTLTFSDQKARKELGWNAKSILESFDL